MAIQIYLALLRMWPDRITGGFGSVTSQVAGLFSSSSFMVAPPKKVFLYFVTFFEIYALHSYDTVLKSLHVQQL